NPLLQALLQLLPLGGQPLRQLAHLAPHLILTPPGHGLGPLHDTGRLLLHARHRRHRLDPHPLKGLDNRPSILRNVAWHVALRSLRSPGWSSGELSAASRNISATPG